MANFNLKAIISAVDKLSPVMKGMNRHIKTVRHSLRNLGEGLGRLRDQLGVPLTIFGAASLASLGAAVHSFAEYGSIINDTATKTGVATKALQEYTWAAKLNGVQQDTLFGSLTKLNKTVATASAGKNKDALALFRKMGISLKDANGHMKTSDALLPEIADGLARIKDPAVRTRAAMALFGKSGAEMLPMLLEGSEGLKAYAKEAQALGLVLSDDDIKNADRLGDNFDKIKGASQGLANTIGAKLAPVINPMIERFIEWYKINREIISQKIAEAVARIAAEIEKIDWKKVIDGIQSFFHGISRFAEMVGGWKNLLIGFIIIANAGVIAALISIAAAVAQVSVAVYGAARAFAIFALANPWLIAIGLAIAVVAGLAYLIYKNWDGISAWFANLWQGVKDVAAGAWEFLKFLFYNFTPLGIIIKNFNPVLDYFSQLVDRIKNFFLGIPNALKEAVEKVQGYLPSISGIRAELFGGDNQPQSLQPAGAPPSLLNSGALASAGGQQRVGGEITVNFKDAPAGTRVDTTKPAAPGVSLATNVGYNSRAAGMPQ